ncbi:MarR family transcriptional regulator [Caloranaerobacter azorensis]|nr:MarR family transcriptional regulator [Caloranaerobacter azorensis]
MKLGVTRVQWIALYYLGKYAGIKQKELAEKMNIKDSTVARLIDRMEREGYVIRVKDLEDKRITKLYLTEKGIELREKLLPEGKKMSEILSKNITDEEMEIFKRVIKKMVDNVR